MTSGVLTFALAGAAAALEPLVNLAAGDRLGPAAPAVSAVDQAYLSRLVRRTLAHALRGDPPYEPAYVPLGLQEMSCRASVGLRRQGRLLGAGDSAALPVAQACREAALAVLAAARWKESLNEETADDVAVEIELIGPRQRVGHGNDDPPALARRFEPGIHGIAVRVDEKEALVRPSQLISMETFCENDEELGHRCDRYQTALDNLIAKLGLRQDPPEHRPESVAVLRFRTNYWYEPAADAAAVALVAGLSYLPPEAATRPALLAAADDLARYIRYRQTSDGFFSYEFLPGRDLYWPDQNWVRQAATAWALALHARRGDARSAAALERAIEAFRKMLRPLPGHQGASFVATPEGDHPLGATAMLCLALADGPRSERYDDLRAELLQAMAAMQRENGGFRTQFPPSGTDWSQNYFPGEALLAIAKHYVATRDARWREVCDRALPFYTRYFREQRPAMFVPWQVQAWGQLARTTRLRKYADFVYEMSDFVVAAQLTDHELPLAIYCGGFDPQGSGRAGIGSAVFVEALVEAARTAAALGDTERAARYRSAVRQASRFVLQLQFRPEECYYVQSPRDVVGGVRTSPSEPTLRIDHAQHALVALLGAAELLPAGSQPATSRPQD